jgi:lipid-A-disaccharide synthase
LKLLVSALEPSSNNHLKNILSKDRGGNIEINGIFEESLGNPLFPSSDFSVMGVFSVLPKIWKAKIAMKKMVDEAEFCHKVLLIDAPAFNLPLAKMIKERYPKKEIIYYILPKVWAWKEKRKERVEKFVDTQISIFPFEKDYYPNSFYFGNPTLDEFKNFRTEPLKNGAIAFLAGSRKGEIRSLMPTFRKLAKSIDGDKILVIPPSIEDISIYGDVSQFLISNSTSETLQKSKFAYICSGTATLEASVLSVPFTLVYKTGKIEFAIGKRFLKLKYVGLANIIFEKMGIGQEFHSEFLQDLDVAKLLDELKNSDPIKFINNGKILRELLKGEPHLQVLQKILS